MSIMRGAEPFYFNASSNTAHGTDAIGCLLVHGFTGTPNEMRWLGTQLAADGRTVLGVRLAGHATSPEEMQATRWPDWYASALEGYRQLRAECERVFVIGLSLGGALALRLAAEEDVNGCVVLAAPLHIRDWRIPVLRPFQRWLPYWRMTPDGADDLERFQYGRMPTIAFLSMLDCFKQVERDLPRVTTPTLFVYSQRDWLA
ncbi:MAG: alpha/beta fold hydrolase, partial [Chloroflexota bacterium]